MGIDPRAYENFQVALYNIERWEEISKVDMYYYTYNNSKTLRDKTTGLIFEWHNNSLLLHGNDMHVHEETMIKFRSSKIKEQTNLTMDLFNSRYK